MRKLAFLAPLGAVLAVAAGPALADPASITVTIGPDLQEKADELGERDVREQADRLAEVVRRALAREGRLDGARIDLVLTDLKPNRPTFEQMAQQPGLDRHRSVSIGGAAIEGSVTTADGAVLPVRYDWYSASIADVRGHTTWQDADRAYARLAGNLVRGRYVSR
ncbi:hypothetical protein GCM10009116_00780 [Brevundimonas basaltis]|uniref:DUF541 domain-containing protein n=1 Tax=Brevundimonas basaltis TaxID=472166 RepID=A0A7W8I1K5_9CAUL|nr:hypothetical protein [Brevundimonas basaltis]MBB5292900.1 hypothetical protein [Brevundimonas basaltis]